VARLHLAVALPVAAQGHDRAAVLKLNQALQWLCCHLEANQMLVAKLRIDRRMARVTVTRRPPNRQARLRRHRMDKGKRCDECLCSVHGGVDMVSLVFSLWNLCCVYCGALRSMEIVWRVAVQ
jgi:hypothetical protein